MTVREMLARIGSDELTEWRVYYGLDPFGEERADLRAGTIASTIANVMSEDGGYKPSDFMPEFGQQPEDEEKTPEQLKSAAIRWAAMFGGLR